jgi:hypothetical protein
MSHASGPITGHFDCEMRRFVIYSPPEIRNWSVTSILVAGNNVWMATSSAGEYTSLPHGLLQWEIAERRVKSYLNYARKPHSAAWVSAESPDRV